MSNHSELPNGSEVESLRAENARLREALAWYADQANYLDCFKMRDYFRLVGNDNGERARRALEGGE